MKQSKQTTFLEACTSVFLSILLSITVLPPKTFAEESSGVDNAKDIIAVTGYGEIRAEPDQAVVTVSVSSINKNVNQAKSDTDKKYESVLAAARSQNIASKDIRSSGLDVRPEYRWQDNSQVLIGARVSRTVSLTLHNIEGVCNPLILLF